MRDDLQRAYSAYQQALYLLPSPKVRTDRIRPQRTPYLGKCFTVG